MTFAISKELKFLAGHNFHVKLTPMGSAVPLREIYLYQGFREIGLRIHRKYQTWIIQKPRLS